MNDRYVDAQEFKKDLLDEVTRFIDVCIQDNDMSLLLNLIEVIHGEVRLLPELLFDNVQEALKMYNELQQDLEGYEYDLANSDDDPSLHEDIKAIKHQLKTLREDLLKDAKEYLAHKQLEVTPEELVTYWVTYGYGNP